MEGDFCSLVKMVAIEKLIPAGRSHIIVDEAHTSAICRPNGRGYFSLLGLNDRVHTVVHTFGEGWGFTEVIMHFCYSSGCNTFSYRGCTGVLLGFPKVRECLINSAGYITFSSALPYNDIYGLQSRHDIILGEKGEEVS
jgi:8-amino-7-oxononanoate synthase